MATQAVEPSRMPTSHLLPMLKWAWGLQDGSPALRGLQWPHRTCRPRDLLSVSWTSGLTHDSHPRQQSRSRVRPSTPRDGQAAGFTHSSLQAAGLAPGGLDPTPQERAPPSCQHAGSPGSRPHRPEAGEEEGGRRHPNLSINTHPEPAQG